MATLKDVAKLACVDVSTVSRALNNVSYVHPETKARIFEAVEQLSYQPNLLAKGLRQGKRNTLGLLIPSIHLTIFAEIAQGIEIKARELGYSVMISNSEDDPEAEETCLNRFRNGLVDGIMVVSTGQHEALLRNIRKSGISVIQLVRRQDRMISSVTANFKASGRKGTEYLISKGCRHIGLIKGSMKITPYKERYEGYHEVIKEHGLKEHVMESEIKAYSYFADGYYGMKRLLEKNPEIDGILAAADMQGIGALRFLKEEGISVPDKVKIVSLTGHSIGGMLETTMTSMEMPAIDMGEKIVNMMVNEIETDKKKREVQHIVFETFLAEREST